jgi:putative phage-type endonuclease
LKNKLKKKSVIIMSSLIRNRVIALSQKQQPVQRSPEWFAARHTRVTASETACCLKLNHYTCDPYIEAFGVNIKCDPEKCASHFDTRDDYLIKKCRAFYGENVFIDSVYTLWGKKYEEIATRMYRKVYKTPVIEFGLLNHPKLSWLGASPDGITPKGVMLEIKCPYSRKIDPSTPPFHYWIQMQIQLEVCNLNDCDFLECEIKQFDNLNEWLSVVGSEQTPKGILINKIEEPDNSETKYIYPPDELETEQEYLDWMSVTGEELNTPIEPVYFVISKWNVIRIKRNKKWFEAVKNDIQETHTLFTKFQNDPQLFEEFKDSVFKLKNKKYLEKYDLTECMIDDDTLSVSFRDPDPIETESDNEIISNFGDEIEVLL